MSTVIYRKYRSQKFSELVGQDDIVKVLRATVMQSKPAHGYLFTGPRGTGKTSTARIFAKAINCLKPKDGDPCGKCDICKLAEEGKLLDIVEIDAASNRGINEIRDLKEKVAFAPVQARYKVYIIDEVHMLTKEAFNALLKTLEEPPSNTIFIAATTEVHKLPQTILSRVVRFDFKLASRDNLHSKLSRILKAESVQIPEKGLDKLIQLARGSYRDAESLLEKVIKVMQANTAIEIEEKLFFEALGVQDDVFIIEVIALLKDDDRGENIGNILKQLDELFANGVNPQQFLQELSAKILELINTEVSEGKNMAILRRLFQIARTIQTLIDNYQTYLDPASTIKLELVNLASSGISLASEGNLPAGVVASAATKINVPSAPVMAANSPDIMVASRNKQSAYVTDNQPIEDTPAKKTAASTVQEVDFSGVDGQDKFSQVVAKVKINNQNLGAILAQGRLLIQGTNYRVLVPYKFHLQMIQQVKNRTVIVSAFAELFGDNLQIVFDIDKGVVKSLQGSASTPNTPAQQAPTEAAKKAGNEELVEEIFNDII